MPDLFETGAAPAASVKRVPIHSDTDIYRAVADLGKFIARAHINLRRDIKKSYGEWMVHESIRMSVLVREANVARDQAKIPHYEEILRQIAALEFVFRVLVDEGWLKRKTFEVSGPLTVSVALQATKLRNHFAPALQ